MIAAALYLGLQQRPAPAPADPGPPERRAGAAEPAPSGQPATRPPEPAAAAAAAPAPAASAPSREAVARDVAKALEAHRAELVQRCWAPSAAKSAEPKEVRYLFNFTFDADGWQIGRGVMEDRRFARPDVTACMGPLLPRLKIPPPGAPVSLDVSFTLP